MISIITKNNATIITIENPTALEEKVIQKARDAEKFSSSDVWAKFKCNQNSAPAVPVQQNAQSNMAMPPVQIDDLSDFEEIITDDDVISDDELPF